MKVQLLLLGAVAILTLGALRLADPVPAASISAPATAPLSIRESSQVPATKPVGAPATIVDAAPTPTPAPIAVVPEAVAAPSAASEPVVGTAFCGTLSQAFHSLHKKPGIEHPAIAIICADALPGSTEAQRPEGDAGD